MKKIVLNENESIESILSMFPPGEHDWYEVKGDREIDLTLPDYNKAWDKDLSKAVGALANSGGGYLVLGAIEVDRNILLDKNGINRKIKNNGTKKWMEDILHTLTDPFIQKIDVYEFINHSGKQLADTALYIVEIEDSPIAPHQSKDNKYYIRIGTSSKPASHQIVMDIMGRKKYPSLDVEFSIGFVNHEDPNRYLREGQHPILVVEIRNTGNIYAEYVNIILNIPKYLVDQPFIKDANIPIIEKSNVNYCQFVRENVITEVKTTDEKIISRSPGRFSPILPGRNHCLPIPLVSNYFDHALNFVQGSPELFWELFADNMPKKSGQVSMNTIKIDKNFPQF